MQLQIPQIRIRRDGHGPLKRTRQRKRAKQGAPKTAQKTGG